MQQLTYRYSTLKEKSSGSSKLTTRRTGPNFLNPMWRSWSPCRESYQSHCRMRCPMGTLSGRRKHCARVNSTCRPCPAAYWKCKSTERRQIARELHDEIGQALIGLKFS